MVLAQRRVSVPLEPSVAAGNCWGCLFQYKRSEEFNVNPSSLHIKTLSHLLPRLTLLFWQNETFWQNPPAKCRLSHCARSLSVLCFYSSLAVPKEAATWTVRHLGLLRAPRVLYCWAQRALRTCTTAVGPCCAPSGKRRVDGIRINHRVALLLFRDGVNKSLHKSYLDIKDHCAYMSLCSQPSGWRSDSAHFSGAIQQFGHHHRWRLQQAWRPGGLHPGGALWRGLSPGKKQARARLKKANIWRANMKGVATAVISFRNKSHKSK